MDGNHLLRQQSGLSYPATAHTVEAGGLQQEDTMNRSETYGGKNMDRTRTAKDTETMVGNGIATAVALLAGGLAALGLLVGFDVVDTENPFNNGLLWLASSITAALGANVFRREHHILDEDEVRRGQVQPLSGGGTEKDLGARRRDDL
jgi:hypothetical protein